MSSGGRDDFDRRDVAWTPPEKPLVVRADRGGARGLENLKREPDDEQPPSLEERMNAPAHRSSM